MKVVCPPVFVGAGVPIALTLEMSRNQRTSTRVVYNKWESRGRHLWQSGGRGMGLQHLWCQNSVGKVWQSENEGTTPKGSKLHIHVRSCLWGGGFLQLVRNGLIREFGSASTQARCPEAEILGRVWGTTPAGVNLLGAPATTRRSQFKPNVQRPWFWGVYDGGDQLELTCRGAQATISNSVLWADLFC